MPKAKPKSRKNHRSGIYKLTIGRWYYYGSSVDVDKRKGQHLRELRNNRHSNRILQNCYNKHGGKVGFRMVEKVPDRRDLLTKEQVWLDKYHGRTFCANLQPVAGQTPINSGPKSEEQRRKTSQTMKLRGVVPSQKTQEAASKARRKKFRPVVVRFDSLSHASKFMGFPRISIRRWMGQRKPPEGLTIRFG